LDRKSFQEQIQTHVEQQKTLQIRVGDLEQQMQLSQAQLEESRERYEAVTKEKQVCIE
jgi:hypothetical protein